LGRRGPAPAPTLLRLAKGERRPSRVNYEEPVVAPVATTAAPAGLDGAGLAEWVRLIGELTTKGLLTIADLTAFENYCRALSELRAYEAEAKKVGHELAIAKGYQGMAVKLRSQVNQLGAACGLSPSSRSGVKGSRKPEESSKDKAARYMSAIRGGRA